MSNKKKNWNFLIFLILLIGLLSYFFVIPYIRYFNFQRFLNGLGQMEDLSGATIVVGAKYEGYDEFLIASNLDKRIHPGSNFKLFTAAAALHYLGPEYVYETKLYFRNYLGRKSLLLVGSGDPGLRKKDLVEFVSAVKKNGQKIDDIFYDDSVFVGEKFGPGWLESWKEQYFAVPITGLQIDDNLLRIIAYENSENGKFEINTSPLENYKLVDKRTYYDKFEKLKVSVSAVMIESDEVILSGDAVENLPFMTSATVIDPSRMTAQVLKQELLKENLISLRASVLPFKEEKYYDTLIWTHSSVQLKDLVQQMLTFSKNNFAESLVRTLGRELKGEGSQKKGVEVLEDFFDEIGILPGAISAFDGSGLSNDTRVTGQALMALFDFVDQQLWKNIFWEALPESKVDGTLKYRFDNVGLKNSVIAKTGSHNFASSLSGKILEDGRNILFTVHYYNHQYSTEESSLKIIPVIDRVVALLDKQW